jgi:hypothetical protein
VALFERYIGIDYSGAVTPMASLKALRVYQADAQTKPREAEPPASPRKYWTRRGIAEWLCTELSHDRPTLVGIDHGFSFPLAYFEKYTLPLDWPAFLDDFQQHWPTDDINTYVDFVRNGSCGRGAERHGDVEWFRRNLCSASTCRVRLQSPRTLDSHGCDISASIACGRFTSGHLMAGTFLRALPSSPRSTRRYG